MGRRSAAEKERIHFRGGALQGQLARQGIQVWSNQFIAPRYEREVAVPTTVGAKRHMNIRGTREHEIFFHEGAEAR